MNHPVKNIFELKAAKNNQICHTFKKNVDLDSCIGLFTCSV